MTKPEKVECQLCFCVFRYEPKRIEPRELCPMCRAGAKAGPVPTIGKGARAVIRTDAKTREIVRRMGAGIVAEYGGA